MIEAIKEIGEYALEKEGKNQIDILNDRVKLSRTKIVFSISLEKNQDSYIYKGIDMEGYSHSKPFLYRGGPPNGADLLPSSLITEDPVKTFNNKILRWFKNREEPDFIKIYNTLKIEEGKVKEEIMQQYNNLNKEEKTNVLLTLKFIETDEEKHLGEIDEFKKILKKEVAKKYWKLESLGESKGNSCCHLCGKNTEVYGFVLPAMGFSFATPDKPGFTPNFSQRDAWKAIPICDDCALYLESGIGFLKENLNFPKKNNFLGFYYYVIPEFIIGEMPDEFYNKIKYYKEKEYEEGLITSEDWLEGWLKEKSDIARLIFMFYTKKGGGKYIDIVQYVEDVFPSWLKRIDRAQSEVRDMPLFGEESIKKILKKEWIGNFVKGINEKGLTYNNWYLKFLKDFFPSTKKYGVYDKEFRNTMALILSNKPVDRDFIFTAFVREIRNSIKKQRTYYFQVLCLKSLMLYLFLEKLDLLKGEKVTRGGKMDEKQIDNLKGRVEALFGECEIDSPEKKAAFSVGMLVDYLLAVQRSERNAKFGEEPFWNKLYGLMLDENKIKNIFKEALAKLRQYQKGYPALEKIAGGYLAKAGEKWHTSRDVLSYYFALGMTLGKTLKPEKVIQQKGGE